MKTMKFGMILAAFFLAATLTVPASADLTVDFDWEIYRINLADWAGLPDYKDYSEYETIYEVHYKDESTTDAAGIKDRKWEFSPSYWPSGMSWEKAADPVYIYTDEEVKKYNGRVEWINDLCGAGVAEGGAVGAKSDAANRCVTELLTLRDRIPKSIPNMEDYDTVYNNFRIDVPEYFNFGFDVVDAWGKIDRNG